MCSPLQTKKKSKLEERNLQKKMMSDNMKKWLKDNMVEENRKKEDDNKKLRKTSLNSVKNLILKHEKIVEEKKSNDHEGMRKFQKDDHLDAKGVNRLA